MKFWQWVGAVILLLIIGGIIYRVVYTLRTGSDVDTDRANALARALTQANNATPATIAAGEPTKATAIKPEDALDHVV